MRPEDENKNEKRRKYNLKMMVIAMAATLGVGFFFLFGMSYFFPPVESDFHKHVFLTVTQDGQKIEVPSDIATGKKPELWNDHSLDRFNIDGIYPIHTHDTTGTIHVETNKAYPFTLQDFINAWGYDIGESPIVKVKNKDTEYVTTPDAYIMQNNDYAELIVTYR